LNVQLTEARMALKSATMREVAQLAGVSIQTVSCVVNGTGSISVDTRSRVLLAIEQLNYRRDPIARSMRTGQTLLIALLVLDITNPVLSIIASAVEAAAYREGYNVILYNVREDVQREHNYLENIANRMVDGLIIVNAIDREHTYTLLQGSQIPCVLVDCLTQPTLASVRVDNFQGAYLATQHLIELGHRRIAHICGAPALEISRQRTTGYSQALADYQLDYQQVVPPLNDRWDYHSGYEAMQRLLESDLPPTAVFTASDQMAIGAYRALAESGYRIPQDMSVVGFDDIDAASFTTPLLTTIRQPFDRIAQEAFALLLKILNGPQPANTQIVLPPQLIIRQSTGAVL
jgi:DNA-binding LacI/PurR family transcriptional regulator